MKIKAEIKFGEEQIVHFSDNTYLKFQLVGGIGGIEGNKAKVAILGSNNRHFIDLFDGGKTYNINLNGDSIKVGNDILIFG